MTKNAIEELMGDDESRERFFSYLSGMSVFDHLKGPFPDVQVARPKAPAQRVGRGAKRNAQVRKCMSRQSAQRTDYWK